MYDLQKYSNGCVKLLYQTQQNGVWGMCEKLWGIYLEEIPASKREGRIIKFRDPIQSLMAAAEGEKKSGKKQYMKIK